ncbi:HmuY family protein [Thalassotalea marina]|uniref:HmuY protein n=1 Tax=Thalassotalea marina TaxID=1673741 RepID=A0A919ELI7_9GAMM|nr:HmuY family protein [Thalassotalea marina]GHF96400.1 hypothetical protein GCM10017161_25950 [Thalassotalea marina]
MKHLPTLSTLSLALLLAACGGGSSSKDDATPTSEPTPDPKPVVSQFGPFATGSSAAPKTVYFDLDNGEVVELTTEQAKENKEWDIAFQRTKVFLNQHADNTVLMHFTANNADFFDQDGKAIADKFTTANAETELEDYEVVTNDSIPSDESEFSGDTSNEILTGFYSYNSSTHQVSAASDNYYIVSSNDAYTKFSVTNLAGNSARLMSDIELTYTRQTAADTEFVNEQTINLDLDMLCANAEQVYVSFEAAMEVTADDAYDLSIPCGEGGAKFDINLHADAKAFQDFNNEHTNINPQAVRYYGFQSNEYSTAAFDQHKWYAYNLEGGHKLWSQYGVYIIKNANGHFKLQITSYYDADGNSGNYTFRANALAAK